MIEDILLLLSKKLKLDIKFYIKNHIFLSMSTVLNIISGFILSILFARHVSQTTFGQYSFVFFLITTLEFTGLIGLKSTLPFVISQGRDRFYITCLKLSFLGSIVGVLALLAIALYYFLPGKPPLSPTLVLAAFFFPFLNALALYGSFFTGKKMFARSSIYAAIQAIVPNLFIAAAILYLPQTFWLVFAGVAVRSLLNIIFTFRSLSFANKKKESPDDVKYAIKLSFVWLIPLVSQHLDKILVAKLLGFEGVAIYSFAILIPQQIANLLKNILPLAISKIGDLPIDQVRLVLPKKSFQLMLLIAPIVFLYIIVSPLLFATFYPSYLESVKPSQIYALGIVFFPTNVLTQSFHHLKRLKNSFSFSVISNFFRLALLILFIPKFGILGAAISFAIFNFLEFLLALVLVRRAD